jgi:outer membrane biogenesis lipoprotein LolB
MASIPIVRSLLLASAVLLVGACVSQPASSVSQTSGSALLERKFQQEARNWQKFQHEGQVVYCQSEKRTASLVPGKRCLTEAALRIVVENSLRERNPVTRPVLATTGSIG